MVIYGVGALALCYLAGNYAGELLGRLVGLDANIGGVGFAMLLLLLLTNYVKPFNIKGSKEADGLRFWQAMFLPVVVAMSASQDVVNALRGGLIALVNGIGIVLVCFAFVPLLLKVGKDDVEDEAGNGENGKGAAQK